MLLYIIRHGDPIYNPDTLTPKGKLQAAAMGKRLSVHGVDKIFSSPNGRARETAQPTCDLMGMKAEIEPWTSEDLAWKDLSRDNEEGQRIWAFSIPRHQLLADPAALTDHWYDAKTFQGTNAKAGYERVQSESDAFLAKLGYVREGNVYRIEKATDERVAVFCHHGFGVTWLSHLLRIHPVQFWTSFDISHSGLTILHFANTPDGYTCPKCLCLSDLGHIYREGLPVVYNNVLNI